MLYIVCKDTELVSGTKISLLSAELPIFPRLSLHSPNFAWAIFNEFRDDCSISNSYKLHCNRKKYWQQATTIYNVCIWTVNVWSCNVRYVYFVGQYPSPNFLAASILLVVSSAVRIVFFPFELNQILGNRNYSEFWIESNSYRCSQK